MRQSGHAAGTARAERRIGPAPTPRSWTITRRLIVLVAIPAMLGLTLAALRLADTVRTAEAYGRIGRITALGQQVNGLVHAMEDERAATGVFIADGRPAAGLAALSRKYRNTDRRAASVRRFALRLDGGSARPGSSVAKILGDIAKLPGLRRTAARSQAPALTVNSEYSAVIGSLFGINSGIASMSGNFALSTSARTLDALSRMENSASLQQAILDAALAVGHFGPGALTALTTAQSQQASDLAAFRSSATAEQNRAMASTLTQPLVGQAQSVERRAIAAGHGVLALDKAARVQWAAGMAYTVGWMRHAEQQLTNWMIGYAQTMHRSAMRSAMATAGLMLAALLLVAASTVIIARSVTRRLARLERAALAGDEASRREHVNAILVASLRRSSFLAEPLLRLIDHFESGEADPERLDALYQMDHLATRMRRISDSALALAGDEAARLQTEPMTLVDLLRAAVSETEQYHRVVLDVEPAIPLIESAAVTATAAVDIVHMLAELLENATTFSPAMTQVEVSGRTARDGGWLVGIADRGIGMPEDQLRQLNEQLADPVLANAVADGHMGLFAVGYLAARHDVRVAFAQRPDGGTTVFVHIPAKLISRAARPVGGSPDPDPELVTGTDTATRRGVALLAAPLPSQADLVPGMIRRPATAATSAQIARTRLASFEQGSRRARADAQAAREANAARDD